MKFLKIIALMMALTMFLALGVACNSGEGDETTKPEGDGTTAGDGATTEAPFITELTIIGIDEEGEEVYVVEKEEAQYNGLKPTAELTMFDVISDYCSDNDIECVLDDATGRLLTVDVYTTAEGGYIWSYELNGKQITDNYNRVIENGAEIVVKIAPLG